MFLIIHIIFIYIYQIIIHVNTPISSTAAIRYPIFRFEKRYLQNVPKAKGKANIELMGVEHFEQFYVKHGTNFLGG